MQRTGVYVLVGPSELPGYEQKLYIGQGGRIGTRIKTHLSGANAKDWWTEVFLLTKTDGELDQADVDHLEARLIRLAVESGRFELENSTAPNPPDLADYKEAEVASFLEDVLPIYKTLGLSFEKGPEAAVLTPDGEVALSAESVPLYLQAVGAEGEGRLTREGFVVLAGATVRKEETASIPASGKRRRQELLEAGVLTDSPDGATWVLRSNQSFSSPSQAAYVLTGSSVSGPLFWKTGEGKPLGELQLAQADAAAEEQGFAGEPQETPDASSQAATPSPVAGRGHFVSETSPTDS